MQDTLEAYRQQQLKVENGPICSSSTFQPIKLNETHHMLIEFIVA